MQGIWQRLNGYPEFKSIVQQLKADMLVETGIDFDQHVMPWIGPEISAGLILV